MRRISELYLPLKTEHKYCDLNEEQILLEILKVTEGTIESAISNIINQTVLTHIHLNIDSTIMQMLTLNDYFTHLFMKNFNILMNNYVLNYLQTHNIDKVDERDLENIKITAESADMKTEFESLIEKINNEWGLTSVK